MGRPTIRDNGVPFTKSELQQRWRRMKRLRKLAEQADRIEDMAYDAMKREEDAAVKAAILRDFGPSRHGR